MESTDLRPLLLKTQTLIGIAYITLKTFQPAAEVTLPFLIVSITITFNYIAAQFILYLRIYQSDKYSSYWGYSRTEYFFPPNHQQGLRPTNIPGNSTWNQPDDPLTTVIDV